MEQSPAGPLQAQLFCNANLPPKPQQSTIPLSAAQQTTKGGEGGREGTQSPARTWATASKPDPKRNVRNPPRAPGQAVLRASPAPSRAAQTGRGYLVKTLLCVFKATSRVLQGHHREMGSKEMFACPAPCQQLLPKHRAPGALLPFTPFPSKSPSTRDESASGKTWLAGKDSACPGWSQTLSWHARRAERPALHGQEAASSIPSHSNPWHTERTLSLSGGG